MYCMTILHLTQLRYICILSLSLHTTVCSISLNIYQIKLSASTPSEPLFTVESRLSTFPLLPLTVLSAVNWMTFKCSYQRIKFHLQWRRPVQNQTWLWGGLWMSVLHTKRALCVDLTHKIDVAQHNVCCEMSKLNLKDRCWRRPRHSLDTLVNITSCFKWLQCTHMVMENLITHLWPHYCVCGVL